MRPPLLRAVGEALDAFFGDADSPEALACSMYALRRVYTDELELQLFRLRRKRAKREKRENRNI